MYKMIYVITSNTNCNASLLPFAPGEHSQWAHMHRARGRGRPQIQILACKETPCPGAAGSMCNQLW
jgi:hypothetical protein